MSVIVLRRSTVLADVRRPTPRPVRIGLDITAPAMSSPTIPAPAASAATPIASSFKVNAPNAITLGGYGLTLAWLAGGPWYFAVAGIAADELDGRVARATGTTSNYGSLLDWAVDITLTGLVLAKLGCPWLLLVVTPVQVYLREKGWAPRFGSARAAFTVLALARGGV